MAVTRIDIAQNVSDKLGISGTDSHRIVASVFELMKEQRSKGDTVKIQGFGNFLVRSKNAPRGRNPQTGSYLKEANRQLL